LAPSRRITVWCLLPLVLLALNVAIAAKLFGVEYSAYLESNEGTFVAIARQIAAHPRDLLWWPFWDCGLPFQNTYLPLLHLLVGFFSRITGHSPALSFHQVTAAFFCLAPVCAYQMALGITGKPIPSFFAALAYSVISPCALFIPAIRRDVGGALSLRRMQILAFYGEGPHTASLAFIPLAILFLYLAMTRGRLWQKILAGVFMSAAVLANAFGAVILAAVVLALLASFATERFWSNVILFLMIGALAYGWISPLLPPSVIAAIRKNSPTVDGDYNFTLRSAAGVAILAIGFLLLWFLATRWIGSRHLRFFLLFAWLTTGIVALGVFWGINVVPQPHRYQIAMDLALCMLAAFAVAELLVRAGRRTGMVLGAVALLALAIQSRHAIRYSRHLIRSTDITQTSPYRIAQWMNANMGGARVMISGADSYYFNDFTDTPQLHGGHDPMLPNFLLRIVPFAIYSGMNTGAQDGNISVLWLKALGAHAISVPGPANPYYNKPFVNPSKFNGLLPVLWREGAETIYGVPARSSSLAHVVDPIALVHHLPINGLDIQEAEKYVDALNAPAGSDATWEWKTWHSATIHAMVPPGQVIATQVSFHPGWHASVGENPQQVYSDGLGFLVVKPSCQGSCDLKLWYDGGPEWRITSVVSIATMLLVLFLALRFRLPSPGASLLRPSHES
jgi:hypothetical protein